MISLKKGGQDLAHFSSHWASSLQYDCISAKCSEAEATLPSCRISRLTDCASSSYIPHHIFQLFWEHLTLCPSSFDRERYDLLASPNGSSMLYKAEIVYALASVELFTILSQRDSCFCLYSVCRLPRYLAIALQESDPST